MISVELDILDSAFKIRIRYDDTANNVMDTVYLSHVQAPVSNIEMATFRAEEFPCLPSGSDAVQQGRENSGTEWLRHVFAENWKALWAFWALKAPEPLRPFRV